MLNDATHRAIGWRMRVFLVHHGEAVGPDVDPQRPLSASGAASCRRLAAACAARGARPAVVWHSGKLRARQTAEQFWRECNPLAEFSAVRGLQPGDPPEWMRDRLSGDPRDVMLVGHVPNMPRLMRLLLTGNDDAALAFPPHGVVALEATGDGGYVEAWRMEEGGAGALSS